ncbi:MAG: MBL fold metallo-hydrolase, partial [Candidatus Omnitrophota bacterium]
FNIVSAPVKHGVPTVAYALIEKDKTVIDPEKAVQARLPEKSELYSRLKEKGAVRFKDRVIKLEDVSMVKKGKKIVYSGDTEICDNLRKLVHGADLLIQDCTYFSEQAGERPYQHAYLPEVLELIKKEKVKRAVLTHISRKHQDADELKQLLKGRENVQLAKDFLTVTA